MCLYVLHFIHMRFNIFLNRFKMCIRVYMYSNNIKKCMGLFIREWYCVRVQCLLKDLMPVLTRTMYICKMKISGLSEGVKMRYELGLKIIKTR